MIARMEINQELNGVELYFSTFPTKATRDNLKANGFKWNHKKSCWYAKRTEKTEAIASIVAGTTEEEYKELSEAAPEVPKKVTKKVPAAPQLPCPSILRGWGCFLPQFIHNDFYEAKHTARSVPRSL